MIIKEFLVYYSIKLYLTQLLLDFIALHRYAFNFESKKDK